MKTIYTSNDDYLVNGTPAAVSNDGVLYINTDLFYKLTPFQREFIKWHEVGHYRLQTSDECEADRYAFNKMAGKYHQSLKQMIGTLETVLNEDTDMDVPKRLNALYELCLKYDADSGNQRAAEALANLNTRVWRGDGEKEERIINATNKGSNDALTTTWMGLATLTQVDNEGDNQNNMMLYLLIGLMVIVMMK